MLLLLFEAIVKEPQISMPQQNQTRTHTLKPSWKHCFWGYALSILTIPLLGLGLVALYFVRNKHQKIRYEISDSQITRIDARYKHNVDLTDIKKTHIETTWLQKQLGIGDLILHTSASKMILEGLEEPQQLKDILEKAIASERKRKKEHQKMETKETNYKPGSMDKMEYLTGLWQQGLISDEDYQKERKHFE